jgi:molybdenum cofactor cytidylyltransferase
MNPERSEDRGALKIAAIVLAAGRSSRMAPRNKLLAMIDGEKMVRRIARAALASSAHPVVVVTGYDAGLVADALRGLDVTVVDNSCWAEGLSTSLRAGLLVLPKNIDGALICLGDMPGIDASVLEALMAAFAEKGRDAICVPVRNGQRGNPVLWGVAYFAEMLALSGDTGAKPLIARHKDRVIEVEVVTDSIFEDFDEPQDLKRLGPNFDA